MPAGTSGLRSLFDNDFSVFHFLPHLRLQHVDGVFCLRDKVGLLFALIRAPLVAPDRGKRRGFPHPTQKEPAQSIRAGRGHWRWLPPFVCETIDPEHGRLDQRRIEIFPADPLEFGLPHIASLVVVHKSSVGNGSQQHPAQTTSYYLSSHRPRRAEFFAQLVRGHWGGCEIRNHWVRDAIFEEDSTRSKNLNLNGNLGVPRTALIVLKSRIAPAKSWPFIRELSSMKVSLPYNMICKNRFK